MSHDWLVERAERFNECKRFPANLQMYIDRIDANAGGPDGRTGKPMTDTRGLELLPGMNDDHMHFANHASPTRPVPAMSRTPVLPAASPASSTAQRPAARL